MDRAKVIKLRSMLEIALEAFAKASGLTIKVGNASFTPGNVTFKVELAEQGENGEAVTREATDFMTYASLWGFAKTDLGRQFSYAGKTYQIKGAKPRSHRFPILCKDTRSGKMFKLPLESVKHGLAIVGTEGFPGQAVAK